MSSNNQMKHHYPAQVPKKNEKSVQDLDCQNANAGANAENPARGSSEFGILVNPSSPGYTHRHACKVVLH